jgi:hypothetical protein
MGLEKKNGFAGAELSDCSFEGGHSCIEKWRNDEKRANIVVPDGLTERRYDIGARSQDDAGFGLGIDGSFEPRKIGLYSGQLTVDTRGDVSADHIS